MGEKQKIMKQKFGLKDYYNMLKARGIRLPVLYFFQNHWFDIINKTDTHKRLDKSDYETKHEDFNDGIWYVCSFTNELKRSFIKLNRIIGKNFSDFQFFDLGSGKGKSLLVFARLFKEIIKYKAIGVEYYSPLVDVASKNIRKLKLERLCFTVEDSAVNIKKYSSSDKIILYLYNPFNQDILKQVINEINEYEEVYIIYVDPRHKSILLENDFNIIIDKKGYYPNLTYTILHKKKINLNRDYNV